MQECKHRDVWLDAIDKHLNGDKRYSADREYVVVSQVSMMNIHLFVFFRKSTIDRRGVVPLSTDSKAMGIGGFVGNKGSICASFVVAETTHICFVVSHFAARASRLNKRQKNYVESVSHLSSHVKHQLLHSYDHIFWMGDFNYRVDLGSHGRCLSLVFELGVREFSSHPSNTQTLTQALTQTSTQVHQQSFKESTL